MENITEIRNSFEQDLINKGYKFFKDHWKESLRGIQKKFTDEKGIRYFITIYHYNLAEQFPYREGIPKQDSYTATNQFSLGNEAIVNIEYSSNTQTVDEIESFFEKVFVDMEAKYYEEYE